MTEQEWQARDIVERLSTFASSDGDALDIMEKASDEIIRLRSALAADIVERINIKARDEILRLRSEIDKAVAAEREACAKVADDVARLNAETAAYATSIVPPNAVVSDVYKSWIDAACSIAKIIRARPND